MLQHLLEIQAVQVDQHFQDIQDYPLVPVDQAHQWIHLNQLNLCSLAVRLDQMNQ